MKTTYYTHFGTRPLCRHGCPIRDEVCMLRFSCPSCQKKLGIKPEHLGKKVKCPGCGSVAMSPTLKPVDTPSPILPVDSIGQDSATTIDMGNSDARRAGVTPHAKIGDHNPLLTDFLAPPQAEDELGRLGKYRILSIIGHGGMGIVFKAEDSVLGRRVAIKAILPSLGAGEQVRKRFLREARAMAAVEHDHIVRLYEVNEDPQRGVPYIAMEFLEGNSLDRRLADEGEIALAEVLQIGREIAEGLSAAHARGLIHRDIKPANIWLERRAEKRGPALQTSCKFRVKILDFGLARDDHETSRITQTGAVLGTPAYMSPEQSQGQPVDFRCDLFSLGAVLYRMTTGREPFTANDAFSTLIAIATETPAAPQVEKAHLPAELSDLIMKLLEKNSANRHGSAQEVADELAEIARQPRSDATNAKPAATISAAPPADVPSPPGETTRSHRWLLVCGALLAMLGCVIVPFASVAAWFMRK